MTIIHNTTAPAPRRLYDVVALALMVIEHDSEEIFNLSHQVPAPYRVEVRRPLFMGQYNILLFINLASTKDTLIKSYSCAHFMGFHSLLPCMLSSSHCMRCQVLISCLTIDYRN